MKGSTSPTRRAAPRQPMASDGSPRSFTVRRTVVLRHELPDGSHHFDWMVASDAAGHEPLVTFRTDARLDRLKNGDEVSLMRLKDHRPRYLTYQGPVDGDRGCVERVAAGVAEFASAMAADFAAGRPIELHISWDSAGSARSTRHNLRVLPISAEEWHVKVLSCDSVA